MTFKNHVLCTWVECIHYGNHIQCYSTRRFNGDGKCAYFQMLEGTGSCHQVPMRVPEEQGEFLRGTGKSVEFLVTDEQMEQIRLMEGMP